MDPRDSWTLLQALPDFLSQQAQLEAQKATQDFQRATEVLRAAKETISLAEQRLLEDDKRQFDSAWQEMLNHATQRVGMTIVCWWWGPIHVVYSLAFHENRDRFLGGMKPSCKGHGLSALCSLLAGKSLRPYNAPVTGGDDLSL